MKNSSSLLISAFAVLSLAPSAAAMTFTSFGDRATFLSDAATAGFIATNEDLTVNPGDPFTIADSFGSGITLDIIEGNFSTSFFGCGGCIFENNPFDGLIQLASTSVTGKVVGIGFDSSARFSSTSSLSLNGGSVSTTNPSSIGSSFLGLLSTDGGSISSLDLLEFDAPRFPIALIDNIVVITANETDVPEPASILGLLTLGALGATSLKRKQKEEA